MKKLHLLKTMLLLCALIVGSGTMWADTERTISTTAATSVSDGDLVVWGPSSTNLVASVGSNWGHLSTTSSEWLVFVVHEVTGGFTLEERSSGNYVYSSAAKKIELSSTNQTTLTLSNTNVYGGSSIGYYYVNGNVRPYASGSYTYTHLYKVTEAPSKTAAGLTFGTHEGETYTVLPGASFDAPTLSNPNGLTVSYGTDDADIANVNSSTGAITVGTKEGTATITASSEEDETYAAGSAKYKIKVQKGTTTVTLNNTALTFNILDGTTQTLTGTPKYNDAAIDGAAVTWSVVSGSDYASVSDAGVVSAIAPGSATIRASYAGTTVYAASTADCTVTVNKANTTLTLDEEEGEIDLKNVDSRTITLTPTVVATKTSGTADVTSPTITWTSDDETVATVSGGVITGKKVGTATITASYAGGTNYNAADDATFSLTVSDTRTAVNMETFTAAKTTLVIDDVQATAVTNDQDGWTAAYTYTSSDETVATVASDGKITAKKKGTATITAALNVDADDADYKAGSTTSKTIDITVTKAFHTVTFSVNGNTDRTASVEEDQKITFPTAVETTPGDGEFPKVINSMTFVGWYSNTYSHASTAPSYVNTASTNMGDDDVTYYAVYADYVAPVHDYVTDELTPSGISNPSTYGNWSGKTATSSAVYAGNSTGGSSKIQINADSPRGIVSTTSGGRIAKVTLDWDSSTSTGRTVQVYGSNTAYTGSSDLHDNSKKGTLLGTIVYGTSTELDVTGDYSYVGLRSSSNALYLSSVTIKWDKGTPASYENYNTTVSALPRPEITMADVEMTWGDTDKYVVPSATVGGDDYDGSFTFTSDSGNLTVASDGKLSSDVPGTYHVTASIAATGEHQAAEKTCTVTVNKKNITVTFAEEEDMVMVSEGSYTQAASVDPVAYDGEVEYSITSDTSDDAVIDDETGELAFSKTAVIVVTATAPATTKYNGNTASYTLKVKTTPTITVSDQSKKVGETYEPTITGGDVTITCNPANMVTVDGNVITAAAIGTTTVTVATAANDTYIAGEANFTMTITDDTEGLDETPAPTPVTLFSDTFNSNNGTGGNDGSWSGSIASNDPLFDETGWTTSGIKGAKQCVKFNKSGSLQTPNISTKGISSVSMTIKIAGWKDESSNLSIATTNGTLSASSAAFASQEWNERTITVSSITADNIKITFTCPSSYRCFLDDIKVTRPGDPIESIDASIYDNGEDKNFATVCSQYPLDLDNLPSGIKAYMVSAVSGTDVTFSRLTGKIKGGVPFILYGAADDYDLPTATSSDRVPSGNLLSGTLAPTYVASDATYYCFGISKTAGKFVKVKGVMPAGKAYLKVAKSTIDGAPAHALNIIFDDGETTGISASLNDKGQMTNDKVVYNLNGQRVAQPAKGMYIVNGRKVVIK